MYLELVIQHLKKLKTLLLFSFFFSSIVYICYINYFNITNSKYSNETKIIGTIYKYDIDGNHLKLEIKGMEKIIINYYIKDKSEYENICKNIKLGLIVEAIGELKKPRKNTNFNLFNYENYLKSKKIYWLFSASSIQFLNNNINIQYKIKNKILKSMENDDYLLLFLLGENNLESEIKEKYQIIGISHLFAISGMHITIITTVLYNIFIRIIKNKKIIFLLIGLFLYFFLFLTNYAASVVRASFFFLILSYKKEKNIFVSNELLLLILLFILLIYNPYYIYDIGFLFSFIVSFTLIRYKKYYENKKYIAKTFITSCLAFIVSIPIMIQNFFTINLLSPLFNLLFIPFISFIALPITIISAFLPFFNGIKEMTIFIMEEGTIFFSSLQIGLITLARMPFYIYFLYYIIIFLFLEKKNKKYIELLFLLLLIHNNIHSVNKYPVITSIDVGQGDATLIELPYDKGNILIDTGGITSYESETWKKKTNYSLAASTIIPYLKSVGIKKLDYLILTHGDYDHIGEAINLIKKFKIHTVLFNSGSNNQLEIAIMELLDKKKIKYKTISIFDLEIEKYKFKFLNSKNTANENEDSLITYTKLNNWNILFMGDAGFFSEKKLISTYNLDKMHILKVGHHGSKYSTSKEFLNTINPDIALISVGLNNRFKHPATEVMNNLKDSDTYLTSVNGMIKITLKNYIHIDTCS